MDDDFTENIASVEQAQRILACLSQRQRCVVVLVISGYTVEEAAKQIGIGRMTAYRSLREARDVVRNRGLVT